jgi:hypothetical protein
MSESGMRAENRAHFSSSRSGSVLTGGLRHCRLRVALRFERTCGAILVPCQAAQNLSFLPKVGQRCCPLRLWFGSPRASLICVDGLDRARKGERNEKC